MTAPDASTVWMVACTAPGQPAVHLRLTPGPHVLGRDSSCDVVLPGRRVSRRHACLHVGPSGADVSVEDLQSFNGTFVDGVRVVRSQLKGGERITVGEWLVHFRVPEASDPAVPGPGATARPANPADFEDEPGTAALAAPPKGLGPGGAPLLQPAAELATPLQGSASWPQRTNSASTIPRPAGGVWAPAAARTRTGLVAVRADVTWKPEDRKSEESVRERAVGDSPLLRKLTQHATPMVMADTLADAKEFAALARNRNATQELALKLLYKVAADLQVAQGEEDFLGHMADTLLAATHAQTVALLIAGAAGTAGDDATNLVPRVVRSQGHATSGAISRGVVEQALRKRVAIATEDARADARFSKSASVLDLDLKAVLAVPMLRAEGPVGVIYMSRPTPFSDAEQDLAAALGHLAALGIDRARLKEKVAEELALRQTLERFHTPEVVEKLMQKQAATTDGGNAQLFLETITASVLFCDLCGFTSYCDEHGVGEVAQLLNGYLGEMTRVVYEFHGTVDKYIGDAVMAVFGAPFPAKDDAVRAARCGLAMQEAFLELMRSRPEGERLKLRVGINTGTVVAGTVGSPLRLEYTCLGDTVNVAQRLESIAAPGQVLVGRVTAEAIASELVVEPRGAQTLKGKSRTVETFEVLGDRAATSDEVPLVQ